MSHRETHKYFTVTYSLDVGFNQIAKVKTIMNHRSNAKCNRTQTHVETTSGQVTLTMRKCYARQLMYPFIMGKEMLRVSVDVSTYYEIQSHMQCRNYQWTSGP